MIESKLAQAIVSEMGVIPTESQGNAIENLSRFLYAGESNSLFLLKGYAGTGKTLLVAALVNTLKKFKVGTVLLAPTGRAAKVLTGYSDKSAFTIHKKIYRQKSSDGFDRFSLDYNPSTNTLFIVDEASMVSNESAEGSIFGSGRLLEDLLEYVYNGHNCRLMLVGDTAQLPPVGLDISQTLDADLLSHLDFNLYVSTLTDVVRQSLVSDILLNATHIRNIIAGGDTNSFFNIEIKKHSDIESVSGEFLIEKISECYDKYGEDETIVVTRSNKRANLFNQGIRRSILWREEELCVGDMLMVVKNNYFYAFPNENIDFVANGDIGKVIKVGKYETLYGFRYANITLQLIDYGDIEIDCKIFLDTLTIEGPSFSQEDNMRLYEAVLEDYMDIPSKKKRWEEIRKNEYFNALQVKYAYSITCHKAQGGQWDAVFIDHGYLVSDMIKTDFYRWLYTAFTRSKKKLYLVNFDKKFFENKSV